MGADVIGRSPCGRRVVVQCKRYKGNLSSPHVQRFAGTARDIHRADVALLVTTAWACVVAHAGQGDGVQGRVGGSVAAAVEAVAVGAA